MAARKKLTNRLVGAGTPLKKAEGPVYRSMGDGGTVRFLGYQINGVGPEASVTISQDQWEQLAARPASAHLKPDACFRATGVVLGWLNYIGPCYQHEAPRRVLERVRALAEAQSFFEIPTDDDLLSHWRDASSRWDELFPGRTTAGSGQGPP